MKRLITLFILFILTTLPIIVLAQPGLPGAPEQTPIDGGLGILAALGGTYAIKKLRDRKNNPVNRSTTLIMTKPGQTTYFPRTSKRCFDNAES